MIARRDAGYPGEGDRLHRSTGSAAAAGGAAPSPRCAARSRFSDSVLFGAVLLLLGPGTVEAQVSAWPVIMELVTDDSATTANVEVLNEGTEPVQLRFYTADFEQSPEGEHSFPDLGSHSRSCGARLSTFPDGATLPPQGQQSIEVRMAPGAETCWSVLFVERTLTGAAGFVVGQRIAVKLYGIAADASREGELTEVTVRPEAQGLEAALRVQNQGTAPIRPRGRLEIHTLTGEVLDRIEVEPFSILPAHERVVAVPFDTELQPGPYLAVPVLDFGGDYLVGGQAAFTVPEP